MKFVISWLIFCGKSLPVIHKRRKRREQRTSFHSIGVIKNEKTNNFIEKKQNYASKSASKSFKICVKIASNHSNRIKLTKEAPKSLENHIENRSRKLDKTSSIKSN